jgi:peptide/nickel transport system substrate-binding protein
MGFVKCRKFQSPKYSVFEIKLIKPFPFLGLMTMKYASVVPKEIEHYGSDFVHINRNRFQFKLWEENVKLVLRKNPLL